MKHALYVTLFLTLLYTYSAPPAHIFQGRIQTSATMPLEPGYIVFPLTHDSVALEDTDMVTIDVAPPQHRVFYICYTAGKRKSPLYRFSEGTVTDTLVVIYIPDTLFYKPFAAKGTCPVCLSRKNVVPVLYGFPSPRMFRAANAGKIALGGCVIWDYNPTRYCKKDHFEF